jgi:hypothetical protein
VSAATNGIKVVRADYAVVKMDQRLTRKTKRPKQRPAKSAGVVAVLESGVSRSGREFWRVKLTDGTEKILRASPSTTAVLREGVKLYGRALRRLADR